MRISYTFGLIEGRHPMPVKAYLLTGEVNPVDIETIETMVSAAIPGDAGHIDLYVTGLTAATLAVVSVCERRMITLTAWHYDRATEGYIPQVVFDSFDTNYHCCSTECCGCQY